MRVTSLQVHKLCRKGNIKNWSLISTGYPKGVKDIQGGTVLSHVKYGSFFVLQIKRKMIYNMNFVVMVVVWLMWY